MITEEHGPSMVHVASQTKFESQSEGIVLVMTKVRGLILIDKLLGRDNSQAWMAAFRIIDALRNFLFNVIALSTKYPALPCEASKNNRSASYALCHHTK